MVGLTYKGGRGGEVGEGRGPNGDVREVKGKK